jgi:hypothetical protein
MSPPGQNDQASSSVFTLTTMLGEIARRVARTVARGTRCAVRTQRAASGLLNRRCARHYASLEPLLPSRATQRGTSCRSACVREWRESADVNAG